MSNFEGPIKNAQNSGHPFAIAHQDITNNLSSRVHAPSPFNRTIEKGQNMLSSINSIGLLQSGKVVNEEQSVRERSNALRQFGGRYKCRGSLERSESVFSDA